MKSRAPQTLADNYYMRLSGVVLFGAESSAQDRLHPEGRKIIGRSDFAIHTLGKLSRFQIEARGVRGGKLGKGRVLIFDVDIIADGEARENILPMLLDIHHAGWITHG